MIDQLTPQERAIMVVIELLDKRYISNKRVRELTGLSRNGAHYLVAYRVARFVPIIFDRCSKTWIFANDCTDLNCAMLS